MSVTSGQVTSYVNKPLKTARWAAISFCLVLFQTGFSFSAQPRSGFSPSPRNADSGQQQAAVPATETSLLRIRKLDASGQPFLIPGATISLRLVSSFASTHRFALNDYGPSFGADQPDRTTRLAPGLYEIGLQIPDGFKAEMSGCPQCGYLGQAAFTQTDGASHQPILLKLAHGQPVSMTFTFKRSALPGSAFADTSENLRCNISGVPDPLPPTDILTFKGTNSWVKLGLNRTIGNVIVLMDLINPSAPLSPMSLIDPRSAGGAAWQISLGGTNVMDKVIHFNQAAGNSARVWGYEAPLSATADKGFVQERWLPLFSNDQREAGEDQNNVLNTSPCYNTGIRIGDGKFSLLYQSVATGDGAHVTRLLYRYAVRHRIASDWKRFQFDFGTYLSPENRTLKVYFPGKDHVVGPIYPYGDLSGTQRDQVRNVVCKDGDCLVATLPISYAVLIWTVQGEEIAVAVHPETAGEKFDGFLRFRPHVTCKDGSKCGAVQWHAEVQDTQLHPKQQASFRPGDVLTYQLDYDVGTPSEIARLGYRLN